MAHLHQITGPKLGTLFGTAYEYPSGHNVMIGGRITGPKLGMLSGRYYPIRSAASRVIGKLGDIDVSAARLGDVPITKIMLGDIQIWPTN